MSDVPTMHLRFVERRKSSMTMQSWPNQTTTTVRILQQMFWVGNKPEWRDVPVVAEEPRDE